MLIWNSTQQDIMAITGELSAYESLQPVTHELSGASWWIRDDVNGTLFTDTDGQTYLIRRRTQVELEATPEYQAWALRYPELALPKIYADVVLTGDVSTGLPRVQQNGTDTIHVVAKLRASESTADDSNVLTMIGTTEAPMIWNIQLRECLKTKHDQLEMSEADPIYDIFETAFVGGVCTFNYYTTNKPAIVYIAEKDFALVTGPGGLSYYVKLLNPVVIKVYKKL